MKTFMLLLIVFPGFTFAQTPSFALISMLTPLPYYVGDTIRCSICSKGETEKSVSVSTNLFSSPPRPASVIFTKSITITLNTPDTSSKFLFTLSPNHCDTVSFIGYYAPFFSIDSLFYMKFRISKITDFETKEIQFNIYHDNSETKAKRLIHKTISELSSAPYYINLLGEKITPQSKSYMLKKKGSSGNRYFEIILFTGP